MTISIETGPLRSSGWWSLVVEFETLLQAPEAEREEILLKLEPFDPSRAQMLRSMLAHDGRHTASSPALPDLEGVLDPVMEPGDTLGVYRIEACVGTGGMGRVYRATSDRDGIRQTVAIKCLRYPGLSPLRIDRFMRERRIMARLNHPNIARFLDAGVDRSGQPFVVMEYVEGVPISEYCRVHELGVRARLELMTQVLQALDYAHRQLVVHRDIKPGNVLVTAEGRPLLVDFGIAHSLHDDVPAESVLATQPGHRHYTPNYAAPEQWTGEETGVATDVYAAATVLYELLTGQTPFELQGLGLERALDLVLRQMPPAPGPLLVKMFALGKRRPDVSPSMLQDLNTVVLHAMKKKPAERYPSVEALRTDIQRILDFEPVSVRTGHHWYRLQTFVRRNRKIVWSSAVLGALLLTSMVLLFVQERQARQVADEFRRIAELNASVLQQIDLQQSGKDLTANVADGLRAGLTRAGVQGAELETRLERFAEDWMLVDPAGQVGKLLQASLLDPGVSAIHEEFSDAPVSRALFLRSMAENFHEFGIIDKAIELDQEILHIVRGNFSPASPQVRHAAGRLGLKFMEAGNYESAEPLLLEAIGTERSEDTDRDVDFWAAQSNLGLLRFNQSRFPEAEQLLRQAIEGFASANQHESSHAWSAVNNLALTLQRQQRREEALPLFRAALAGRKKLDGPHHPKTLSLLNNLGTVLVDMGKFSEARDVMREAVEIRTDTLGLNHPDTVLSRMNFAEIERQSGQPKAAREVLEDVVPRILKIHGPLSQRYNTGLALLGLATRDSGDLERAEQLLRESLQLFHTRVGPDHFETLAASSQLGTLLQMKGEFAEAERLFHQVLAKRAELLGPLHQTTLRSSNALARLYVQIQRHAAALDLLEPLADAMRAEHEVQGKSENWCKYLTQSGRAHLGLQAWDQAVQRLEQAEAVCLANPNASIGERRDCLEGLVDLYSRVPQQALTQPREQRLQAVRAVLAQLEEKRSGR